VAKWWVGEGNCEAVGNTCRMGIALVPALARAGRVRCATCNALGGTGNSDCVCCSASPPPTPGEALPLRRRPGTGLSFRLPPAAEPVDNLELTLSNSAMGLRGPEILRRGPACGGTRAGELRGGGKGTAAKGVMKGCTCATSTTSGHR